MIKAIHDSDIYAVIIETGCSVPVANSLLDVSGASKTVYFSQCPYSKEYNRLEYKIDLDKIRSVSDEYVINIIKHYSPLIEQKTINTIYCASFQISDSDAKIITHGWIGIRYKNTTKLYHITIRGNLSRLDNINKIKEIGLNLLSSKNDINKLNQDIDYNIDIIKTYSDFNNYIYDTDIFKLLKNDIICFKNNIICRAEELFRDKKEIIIYKGSFNPPTKQHINIMKSTINDFPNATPVFMISVNTIDKKEIDYQDLIQRIKYLSLANNNIIINKNGKFIDCINYFKNNFPSELIFPVGSDTSDRIEKDIFELKDVNIKIFPRTETSSTQVRQSIKNKDIDKIKELVPIEIFDLLINNTQVLL